MPTIREIIKRDIGVKIEGVVKVFDHASLATDIREYVVTDKIEHELKRIFDTFTHVSETLRRGGPARDVMGIWASGFFGSGKSHLAKVLGHILHNTPLDDGGSEHCIDAFVKHLSNSPAGRDLRLRLGELKLNTDIRTIFFEIKSLSFDQVFDAVQNDLLSQEYLGASGVRAIYESDERVPHTPVMPARVLKVLWLLQRVTWVPRVPEILAKLLTSTLTTDLAQLRTDVEATLLPLQEAGYVARDEATGEWKFLNERERTIEQAIQEMVRPGGPKSINLATVRRTSQQICKDELLTRKRLGNFAVAHGVTKVTFAYGVHLDGEAVDTGPELEIRFLSPLAPGRSVAIEEIGQQNQAGGAKGRIAWWLTATPESLEGRLKRYESLVKVTSDKRFTEDSSADTQDALAEKRKERDEMKIALVRDLERAFLGGTLLYGGQEVDLEGAADLKDPIRTAFQALIPNVYPRFHLADRAFDFAKQLKALLNPTTTNLHQVARELDLFDTQGSLQRESALVGQVVEVLADLADEGLEPEGGRLLDAKDDKGFKGFLRPPFGWPEELVRLVLAGCFRAGALYIEKQTPLGPSALYDYKGTDEIFSKITAFRKSTFRVAETSLSVDQIKNASKALIAMGRSGTPESGNAIAAAVRDLGLALVLGIQEAKSRHELGLPISDAVLKAEAALTEPTTAKDPTTVVTAFLAKEKEWKALKKGLDALRAFLDANRHQDYETSRRLIGLAADHPIPDGHPKCAAFVRAEQDLAAIAAEKTVIARWNDYRSAFDTAFATYRDVYLQTYDQVRHAAEAQAAEITAGAAYQNAPLARRDAVVDKVFGVGKLGHYAPLTLATVDALLTAAGKRSLSALDQALVALPAYRAQVESERRTLVLPPPEPFERVFEWRPVTVLAGRRFKTEDEVDQAFDELADDLKAQIREGFTVAVK